MFEVKNISHLILLFLLLTLNIFVSIISINIFIVILFLLDPLDSVTFSPALTSITGVSRAPSYI